MIAILISNVPFLRLAFYTKSLSHLSKLLEDRDKFLRRETITIRDESGTMSLFEMITRKPEASNSFGFSDCNTCTHTHNRAYPLSGAVTIIVKQRAIATCRIVAAVATTWRFRTWEHGVHPRMKYRPFESVSSSTRVSWPMSRTRERVLGDRSLGFFLEIWQR